MKSLKNITLKTLICSIAIIAAQTVASAQTITALDLTMPVENVNTVPSTTQGPANTGTTGTQGYEFFSTAHSGDISSLPTYVSGVADTASGYGSASFSSLTVGSTTYNTGVLYANSYGTSDNLATITLQGTVPSTFDLGLLADNADTSYPTLYTLSLYSGVPGATGTMELDSEVVNTSTTSRFASNDFYYASISGASAGDEIVISGSSSSSLAVLGGVTFDSPHATVPEPSTIALMGSGLGLLLMLARRRRSV